MPAPDVSNAEGRGGLGLAGADPGSRPGAKDDARARRRAALAGGLFGLFAGLLLLLAHAHLFDPSRIHLGPGFVDQVVYVTTGRSLASTGELGTGIVYPAYADRPSWRPYMPGHFVALAASHRLFEALGAGESNLANLLPSLAAFVLAAACLGALAGSRCGRTGALLAVGLWLLFPVQLVYAWSAMAESTFLAAGIVAFGAFLALPARLRPWIGPLLLGLPFLFRETGALWVVPMVLVVALDRTRRRPAREALALLGLSVVVALGLQAWQQADGKGSLPLEWAAGESFNYRDATREPPATSLSDLAAGSLGNARRNLGLLAARVADEPADPAVLGFLLVVAASLGLAAVGWRRRRDEPLVLGAGALGLAIVAVIVLLYDVKAQKAVRTALFVTPLLALGVAAVVAPRVERLGRPRKVLVAGLALALLVGDHALIRRTARELRSEDAGDDRAVALLESLHPDPARLLVAPHDLFGPYAIRAFPVLCSFLPANDATLALLAERRPIGTLVTPSVYVGEQFTEAGLARAGLRLVQETPRGDFHVYRSER